MEYIYTNLPRYEKLTAREELAESVVKEGHVLLFSEDGETLTAKLPDGSFQAIGGGSGAFYQCASVDTAAGTWTGYKWNLNDEGIYELETELTTDELTVMGLTPIVGQTYSADTRVSVGHIWKGVYVDEGLVFYAPLTVDYNTERGSYSTVTIGGTFTDNALSLNGSQYVEWAGDENIPSGTSAMSIAGRVYIANIDDAWTYFFGFSGGSNDTAFGLNMEYEALACRIGFDWKYLHDMQTGVWYHLALTRSESGEVTAYVDGVSVGTTTTSNSVGNSIITVGANGGQGYNSHLTGSVSSFRIYNRELTAEEVSILANEFNEPFINIDDTLSLTFKLNEPISHILGAKDSLGNACSYEVVSGTLPTGIEFDGSTGAFSGTPTVEETVSMVIKCSTKKAEKEVAVTIAVKEIVMPEEGLVFYAPLATDTSTTTGQTITGTPAEFTIYKGVPCAKFTSDENKLTSPMSEDIPVGNAPNTVAIWVCINEYSNDAWASFMRYGVGGNVGDLCGLYIRPDTQVLYGGVFTLNCDSSTVPLFGTWYHMALTYDGTTAKIYINGSLENSVDMTYAVGENGTIYVGATDIQSRYLAGARIYSRALTAGEITELANEFKEPYISIDDTISTTFKPNESGTYALNAVECEGATTTPTGNTVKYALVSSDLPSAISFDEATGVFSGTPDTEATYTAVVRCYVEGGAEKEVTVSILVTSRTPGTVSGINYTSYSCPINPTDYSYENWVISASSELGGQRSPYNAFYDWETLYEEQAGWCSADVGGVAYLQWQNTVQPVLVNAYSMTNVERSNCLPTAWTFEGSNDGTSWEILDTVSGHNPTSGGTIHRILTNTTSYSYYRVNVTAVNDWGYVTIGLIRAGVGDAAE